MQQTVKFGIRCSQHHREWAEIKEWFVAADEWGLESAWVFDHMIPLSDPRTGPNLEGWTLLAGLAEATSNIEIGPMVTGITYRNPAMLLKNATTVDHISNGRALLGVGAAWFEGEHKMFGFDFPGPGARVSMLDESLQMFTMLQSQERSSFDGTYYQLDEAIFEPKPVRNPMPVVIGGSKPRMLRLIARHADQWDNNISNLDEYLARVEQLENACRAIGRDPSEIRRSTTLGPASLEDEGQLRSRMQELRDAGITDFLFHVPEEMADIRPLIDVIIPEMRAAWTT